MSEQGDKHGEIIIEPFNTMSASYRVIGADNSNVDTEITATLADKSDVDTEVTVIRSETNATEAEVMIMIRGNSVTLAEIHPLGSHGVIAEIEVNPNNTMGAIYEIQEPPRIEYIKHPLQDSFVRDEVGYESINYGSSSSLVIGNNDKAHYATFVDFDFNDWSTNLYITVSKLKLYYTGFIPKGTKISLYSVEENWYEDGITYLNKPITTKIDNIDDYVNNTEKNYVEFNVTDLIREWTSNQSPSNGLMIKVEDELEDTIIFRSRESSKKPELIIEYYDTKIYSLGRSNVLAEIDVWYADNSDVLTEISVGATANSESIPMELYVHRYDTPVPHDMETELFINRELMNVEITAAHRVEDKHDAELTVYQRDISIIDTEIVVSKTFQYVEVIVPYKSVKEAELTIQRYGGSNIPVEIASNKPSVDAEIFVKHEDALDTEIVVKKRNSSNTLSEITISAPSVAIEIFVKYEDAIDTELTSRQKDESIVLAEIAASVPTRAAEIYVKYEDAVDMEIQPKVIGHTVVDTKLSVTRREVLTEIQPRILKVSNIDTEITVERHASAYAFII